MLHTRPNLPLALLTAGVLALSACESATEPEEEEHGEEVEGVILVMSGRTVASYDGELGAWTGRLEGVVGEESPHINVNFVDHEGNEIELDDDFHLQVEVEDPSFAEFEQDTPGEFGGHLHGEKAGETRVVFSLMHGPVGAGHADFVTEPLDVHVR